MQIILIEDDKRISDFILKGLEENGHFVTLCKTAEDYIEQYLQTIYDLIICDIMLPGMDGLAALKKIRSENIFQDVYVIMLTAKTTEMDKVSGLNFGADDYIAKPFSILELSARINALFRRSNKNSNELLFKDILLDLEKHQIIKNNKILDLTLKEYELLKVLIENKEKTLTREELLNLVWGYNYIGESRTLDMHIKGLRNKLGDDITNPIYIKTIRGVGYTMVDE